MILKLQLCLTKINPINNKQCDLFHDNICFHFVRWPFIRNLNLGPIAYNIKNACRM